MKKNKLPYFFVVGAAKAGTTSLDRYLRSHPEINLSKKQKEGRFFSDMPRNTYGPEDPQYDDLHNPIPESFDHYLAKFDSNNNLKGDISPDYLYYYDNSIRNVLNLIGDHAKIIIILRNPADRAFSHYLNYRRDYRETLTFEYALEEEETRKQKKWNWAWRYTEVGLYYKQVKAYLEEFKEVKIFLFEDLKSDTQKVVDEICVFLGVSKIKIDSDKIYNQSGIPKKNLKTYLYNNFVRSDNVIKKTLQNILPANTKNIIVGKLKLKEKLFTNNLEKPQMKPETRKMLIEYYKEDILKLQELIGRDLTHWLK